MAEDQDGGTGAYKTPPYVAFKTFNTLIEDLKEHGLPSQIDRSVLRRFSGGVGSQLVSALKALRLVTDDNRPTTWLQNVVEAYGTDDYKTQIATLLQNGYPYVAALDLKTATPAQFADAFKVTGAKEDVLRKSRTFYLHAAQFAGVEIGSRLLNGSAPRRAPNGGAPSRRKPQAKRNAGEAAGAPPPPSPQPHSTGKPMEYQLIDLLKVEGISEDESAAIWTLVRFLTDKNKAAGQ